MVALYIVHWLPWLSKSSAHWPNEVEALRKCKTAFYLQISSMLSDMKDGQGNCMMHTIPRSESLDVLFDGYAFRIVIYQRKELQLLKQRHRTLLVRSRQQRPEHAKASGGITDEKAEVRTFSFLRLFC